jgi:Ca2+-transporting ATPase
MDTFAALALATEPSYKDVMDKAPRKVSDFIVTGRMMRKILEQGALFLVVLIVLLLKFKADGNISLYELSAFFTIFVMLQFWNMFNARTLGTNNSAFYKLKENKSFLFIAAMILVFQIIIVQFGGGFFRTEPLTFEHWCRIIAFTSVVLWIEELMRFIKKRKLSR